MTTKFLDNKICTFKILLSWRFPGKTAFWTSFLSAPKAPPPPQKNKNFIFIVVSPSLKRSWCRTRVTVRVSRHHCGQTLYLSRRCGIPPPPLPLLYYLEKSPRTWPGECSTVTEMIHVDPESLKAPFLPDLPSKNKTQGCKGCARATTRCYIGRRQKAYWKYYDNRKIVNFYAVVLLLRPPYLLRRRPLLERDNVCNSRKMVSAQGFAAIVNHNAEAMIILRIVIHYA